MTEEEIFKQAIEETVEEMTDEEAMTFLVETLEGDESEELGFADEALVTAIAKIKPNVRNKYLKRVSETSTA